MKFLDLLEKIDYITFKNQNDQDFKDVTFDSRKVSKTGVFVAIKGFETDGHKFIASAIKNGAECIVYTDHIDFVDGISYIRVKDARIALAQVSNALTDFPSRKLRLVGVTGTNGKTSTATFLYRIFKSLDGSCANIGTDGTFINGKMLETQNTTPEISDLNGFFKKALDEKVKNAVIEASSHGLSMHRLDGVDFDYGVFTNLSIEHMDFHKTMGNYFEAKMILLKNAKRKLVNIDDPYGKRAKERFEDAITFSIKEDSDYRALDIKQDQGSLSFKVNGQDFLLHRYALFDIYNILPAIAILNKEGYSLKVLSEKVGELDEKIASRFEFIENDLGINIVIDFAHTPLAFDNTYGAIEKGKRIIAVYGMSGDRTPEIRKKVGEISAKHKVMSVVTSDDPKFDTYENIANDIISGIEEYKGQYVKIKDRKEAIKYALKLADKGDFVLLLGKGEENFIKLKGNEKTYYSEKETVKEVLKEL